MYAPLPLFEIDSVRRELPMDHRVAVRVEVEALLTDRSRGEHERPERRVERLAHLVRTRNFTTIFGGVLAEPGRESRSHGPPLERHLSRRRINHYVVDPQARRA